MGLTGFAARASGVKHDLRVDYPVPPYRQLDPRNRFAQRGDVAAARFGALRRGGRIDPLVQALVKQLRPRGPRAAREGQARAAVSAGPKAARGNPRRAGDR